MLDPQTFVEEVAQLLHLNTGLAPDEVPPRDEASEDHLKELLISSKDFSSVERLAVFGLLAADYLPSLVAITTVRLEDRIDPSEGAYGLAWLIAICVCAMPTMSRWVREHAEGARRLLVAVAHYIGHVGRHYRSHDEGDGHLCYSLCKTISFLLELIVVNVAEELGQLHGLDPITSSNLRDVLKLMKDRRKFQSPHVLDLYVSLKAHDSISLQAIREGQGPVERRWSYWTCETVRTVADATACSALPAGAEMSVCSRCLTVRYCSRAHQKADWKQHKPECFQPSW